MYHIQPSFLVSSWLFGQIALIIAVTSSIFLPSIPEMSVDLKTSATVLNYTVAIFLVTIGAAPLIWSPLSGFYGRKPVYLISMPIHVAASIGVGRSQNVGALIGTRILQGIGGSSVVSSLLVALE